jgi:hypothetical protein
MDTIGSTKSSLGMPMTEMSDRRAIERTKIAKGVQLFFGESVGNEFLDFLRCHKNGRRYSPVRPENLAASIRPLF